MSVIATDPIHDDKRPASRLEKIQAVVLGCLLTLAISGYQFGRGNHTVYLLDALRRADPALLKNDWFTTSTLQYHFAFSAITDVLMRAGVLEIGFHVAYLALILMLHLAWFRAVSLVGGSVEVYLVSVVIFYIAAGGLGLGVYQFLQDCAFLPSNIANVALLWGLVLWMQRRIALAGLAIGIAAIFHLNHAIVGVGIAGVLGAWWCLDARQRKRPSPLKSEQFWIGALLAIVPAAINITSALSAKVSSAGSMPIGDFVQLYVRFRHWHHFDALRWPIGLWLSFLAPIPLAVLAVRQWRREAPSAAVLDARRDLLRISAIILILLAFALVFAGIFFVSETLIQLSLWRFSIYPKLLLSIAAAYFLVRTSASLRSAVKFALVILPVLIGALWIALVFIEPSRSGTSAIVIAVLRESRVGILATGVILAAIALTVNARRLLGESAVRTFWIASIISLVTLAGWTGNRWGVGLAPPPEDADYLSMCRWVQTSTPLDAVFLVPPDDSVFRLEARRAIVVNFKHVPQLSGELVEWERRLKRVLALESLNVLPSRYQQTLSAIRERYNMLDTNQLVEAARSFDASYIIVGHPIENDPRLERAFESPSRRHFVYRVR